MDMTGQTVDDYRCKPPPGSVAEAGAGFSPPRGERVGLMARSQDAIADLAGEIGKAGHRDPLQRGPFRRDVLRVETALGAFWQALMCCINNAGRDRADLAIFAASDPDEVVSGHRYHSRASYNGSALCFCR